jgi:hypothetical protein
MKSTIIISAVAAIGMAGCAPQIGQHHSLDPEFQQRGSDQTRRNPGAITRFHVDDRQALHHFGHPVELTDQPRPRARSDPPSLKQLWRTRHTGMKQHPLNVGQVSSPVLREWSDM